MKLHIVHVDNPQGTSKKSKHRGKDRHQLSDKVSLAMDRSVVVTSVQKTTVLAVDLPKLEMRKLLVLDYQMEDSGFKKAVESYSFAHPAYVFSIRQQIRKLASSSSKMDSFWFFSTIDNSILLYHF
jgi:hypothetical protein